MSVGTPTATGYPLRTEALLNILRTVFAAPTFSSTDQSSARFRTLAHPAGRPERSRPHPRTDGRQAYVPLGTTIPAAARSPCTRARKMPSEPRRIWRAPNRKSGANAKSVFSDRNKARRCGSRFRVGSPTDRRECSKARPMLLGVGRAFIFPSWTSEESVGRPARRKTVKAYRVVGQPVAPAMPLRADQSTGYSRRHLCYAFRLRDPQRTVSWLQVQLSGLTPLKASVSFNDDGGQISSHQRRRARGSI